MVWPDKNIPKEKQVRHHYNVGRKLLLCGVVFSGLAIAGPPANKTIPSQSEEAGYVVEKRSDGTTVKYKKKTTYDFEGASIDGIYNKPSGAYVSNIKDVKGRSVIHVRENFDTEVVDSARLLQ